MSNRTLTEYLNSEGEEVTLGRDYKQLPDKKWEKSLSD